MNDVIDLIAEVYSKNDLGVVSASESKRTVFCSSRSVSRADFYAADQAGLALSHVFVTDPVNYNGERLLEYHGERFAIVRTYHARQDVLEIYTGYRVGVANDRSEQGS